MSRFHSKLIGFRFYGLLGAFALVLGALAAWTGLPSVESTQGEDEGGEAPIEVLVVQGYVKQIDDENLVLTAPGAPHDLPLVLHPETRYVNGEEDVGHDDVHEGQFVRAALIPAENGEDLMAIVVEIVPEEEAAPPPSTPPGDPGNLGESDPPRFDPPEEGTKL